MGNNIDARQAAAAPRTAPKLADVTADTFHLIGGPLAGIFMPPVFKPSDSAKVNENERTKIRSKKVANVTLSYRTADGKDSGFYVRGSIYADLVPGAKVPTARFTFFGANMQSSVGTDNENAKNGIEAIKEAVKVLYGQWRKANPVTANQIAESAVPLDDMGAF